MAWSPNSRILAVCGTGPKDGEIQLWRPGEDKPAHTLATALMRPTGVTFSRDGRWLAVYDGSEPLIEVWDVARRKLHARFERAGMVEGLAFDPHGKLLASATGDGAVRLWGVAKKRQLASLVALGARDWAVSTPDGLFDGTPGAQALMEWRIGDRLYGLEQFFNDFYSPSLLARLLAGERPRPRLDMGRLRPPPEVRIVSPAGPIQTDQPKVRLRVVVQDRGGGTSPVWIYHNGHRLPTPRGAVAVGGVGHAIEVELVEGRNHLRATSFNADRSVESRGDEVSVQLTLPPAQRPTLFILAAGIDKYRGGMNLNFARADARAIAKSFPQGLFGKVEPRVLLDTAASRQGLLEALKQLAKVARPRDAVIVYLAGHGTLVGQVFYFLPWDARVDSEDAIRISSISQQELGEALTHIRATKQILVLDACHSGASAKALGAMLASRDAVGLIRAQQRLARSSGTFLIAAATSDQYAKEVPELGHGVLTYAFLRGLGLAGKPPAATLNADRQVTVNALLGFLADEVPRLTAKHHGGRQNPVQASTGQDFPLVVR